MSVTGIVIIGRNEGERLRRCLPSVAAGGWPVVYVDSGSTDGSGELARSMGVIAVALDPSIPFSAARARNEGFARLMREHPNVRYVQFVDGDCEVFPNWIERGMAELDARPDVVVVCGHVRERFPDVSMYNRLCDLEWRRDAGEIKACGGIFMVRAGAFAAVNGFRCDVIAAEDDELCLRLRRTGCTIKAIDADMVWHDAAMTRFGQWWIRAKRCGHAYAQGAAIHGQSPDRHFVRQCRGLWVWGLIVPVLAIAAAWWTRSTSLLMLGAYPLLAVRIYRYGRRRGWSGRHAWLYAIFNVLAKWPMLIGMLQYHRNRIYGRQASLIEYKGAGKSI